VKNICVRGCIHRQELGRGVRIKLLWRATNFLMILTDREFYGDEYRLMFGAEIDVPPVGKVSTPFGGAHPLRLVHKVTLSAPVAFWRQVRFSLFIRQQNAVHALGLTFHCESKRCISHACRGFWLPES